jgi:hypothetical protein
MVKTREQIEAEMTESTRKARIVREASQALSRALAVAEPSETSRPVTVERPAPSPVRERQR